MLGAGLQFGRSRGDDRFYNPAKARSARKNKKPALEPVASPSCNLDRFLESILPSAPAQYLSKVNSTLGTLLSDFTNLCVDVFLL